MKQLIFFILILTVATCTTSTTPPDSSLYKSVDTVKKRLDRTEIKVETMSLLATGLTKSQQTQVTQMINAANAPLLAQIKALQDTLKVYKSIGSTDFSKNASGQTIISPAGIKRIKMEMAKLP